MSDKEIIDNILDDMCSELSEIKGRYVKQFTYSDLSTSNDNVRHFNAGLVYCLAYLFHNFYQLHDELGKDTLLKGFVETVKLINGQNEEKK